MRITSTRPGVVTVTAATSELSALAAGARMALALMRADPRAPAAAAAHLGRVLDDYDRGIRRATGGHP
jgi:hypothetical protein